MEPIVVSQGVSIPAEALRVRFARSSGPGGQNVNKVASKVDLRLDPARIVGLSGAARARLDAATRRRRDADGLVIVVSQRTRDQHRNLEDARERLRALVAGILHPPIRRRPTAPSASSREARLRYKRRRGERKRARHRPDDD